jgi:hypothetical protein
VTRIEFVHRTGRPAAKLGVRFADRHGVTLSCFDYWRRQVREACPDTSIEFARVRVIADDVPPDAGVLEVVLAHGERVVIRAGASGDLVRQVVAALRASLTISPAVRIYVATGTTDLRRSIDAFSLKSKVRTIKKARSGMTIA